MNIDLGSPVLDIAIGLSFIFFLLSVIASGLTEAWAWARKLRAKTLREGLEGMTGDPALVKKIFEHPVVRTELVRGGKRKAASVVTAPGTATPEAVPTPTPAASVASSGIPQSGKERGLSYISPRNFAAAFKAEAGSANAVTTMQLKALGYEGDLEQAPTETLEKWFEDAMDRVNGWYKRHAQIVTIGFALLIAFSLNANTFRIVERLDKEPTVRSAVMAQAEAVAKEKSTTKAQKEKSLEETGEAASGAYDKLAALKIPLGWAKANVPSGLGPWLLNVLGWILTAIAISLGAPFWFDALNKFVNLRATGKKPKEGAAATE